MTELEEKIYKGEKLTESELRDAVWELEVVDEIEGSSGRWNQIMQSIIVIKDKLFAINWQRGLTEHHEHIFDEQPYEVERKTRMVKEVYYIKKVTTAPPRFGGEIKNNRTNDNQYNTALYTKM